MHPLRQSIGLMQVKAKKNHGKDISISRCFGFELKHIFLKGGAWERDDGNWGTRSLICINANGMRLLIAGLTKTWQQRQQYSCILKSSEGRRVEKSATQDVAALHALYIYSIEMHYLARQPPHSRLWNVHLIGFQIRRRAPSHEIIQGQFHVKKGPKKALLIKNDWREWGVFRVRRSKQITSTQM